MTTEVSKFLSSFLRKETVHASPFTILYKLISLVSLPNPKSYYDYKQTIRHVLFILLYYQLYCSVSIESTYILSFHNYIS